MDTKPTSTRSSKLVHATDLPLDHDRMIGKLTFSELKRLAFADWEAILK